MDKGEIKINAEQKLKLNVANECSVCKDKFGVKIKCEDLECQEYFHVLCAYLEGY